MQTERYATTPSPVILVTNRAHKQGRTQGITNPLTPELESMLDEDHDGFWKWRLCVYFILLVNNWETENLVQLYTVWQCVLYFGAIYFFFWKLTTTQ